MTSRPVPVFFLLIAASLFAALAGCAPAPRRPEFKPVFYPSHPGEVPRVQFLLSFGAAEFWLRPQSSFAQFVLGGETQVRGEIKSPYGLAARDGRLYICDLDAAGVHVIDLKNRQYSVLGTPEQIENPVNIAFGPDGTRYVCDTGRSKLRVAVFNAQDEFVRAIKPPGGGAPSDVAVVGDELVVADVADATLEVWTKQGELVRTLATKGRGPAQLRMPQNLDIGPNGHIFVTDTELATIKEYTLEGEFVKSIGIPGDRPGNFARPKGIAIDEEGHIFVADSQWNVVQVFSTDGNFLLFFGGATPEPHGLGLPAGLAIDTGALPYLEEYVSDGFEPRYLLFVANQFAPVHKINVYAFGSGQPLPLPEPEPAEKADEAQQPASAPAPETAAGN